MSPLESHGVFVQHAFGNFSPSLSWSMEPEDGLFHTRGAPDATQS